MNEMSCRPSDARDIPGMCERLQHFEDMCKDIIADLKAVHIVLTGNTADDAHIKEPTCVLDAMANIDAELELCMSLTRAIKREF